MLTSGKNLEEIHKVPERAPEPYFFRSEVVDFEFVCGFVVESPEEPGPVIFELGHSVRKSRQRGMYVQMKPVVDEGGY